MRAWSFSSSQPGYLCFRDRAVGQAIRRRELWHRRVNKLAAALLLVGAFWGVRSAASPASTASPGSVPCLKAGQNLAPWFKAERQRRAWAGAAQQGDFIRLAAWFRDAQGRCAAGLTDEAVANFGALARQIAALEDRRRPAVE